MKNKVILLLILSFIFVSPVYALETCEMSDAYKEYLELSEEERANVDEPAYCASQYENPQFILQNHEEESLNGATTLPSKYNAYNLGYVTSIKDQMDTGSCWAFQSTSLVETAAIKSGLGVFDFSERHIEYSLTLQPYLNGEINPLGFYRRLDDGGFPRMAASYYYRMEGPIPETSMPFVNDNSPIDKSTMPNEKAKLILGDFKKVMSYDACSTSSIEFIKNSIIKYGSVGVNLYFEDESMRGYFINNNSSNVTNHAVVLVGWDDSISSSNFPNSPSRNGAFIIKNSWGTSYGNKGFYYVSYDDITLCDNISMYTSAEVNTYDGNYFSSPATSNCSLTYNGYKTAYAASKFVKKAGEDEYIDRISFETFANSTYEIYYSFDTVLTNSGSWVKIGDYEADFSGIKTIKFDYIPFTQDMFIIIKETNVNTAEIPVMCKSKVTDINNSSSLYSKFQMTPSTNYIGLNPSSFTDIYNYNSTNFEGCENVIYLYTRNASSVLPGFDITGITSNVDKVYSKSSDYFTVNLITKNITDYNLFDIKVYDGANKDVTTLFDIKNDIESGNIKVYLKNVDIPESEYKLVVTYEDIVKEQVFNVYVHTPEFDITGMTSSADKVYSKSSDYFTVDIEPRYIEDFTKFKTKIVNNANEDVTSMFNLTSKSKISNYTSIFSITIELKDVDIPEGKYKLVVNYLDITKEQVFDIYVHVPEIAISSIIGSSEVVESGSNGFFDVSVTTKYIDDFSPLVIKIYNSKNEEVNSLFNIDNKIGLGKIKLYLGNNDIPEDTYVISLSYGNVKCEGNFKVVAKKVEEVSNEITSSVYNVTGDTVIASFSNSLEFKKSELINSLSYKGNLKILNGSNEDVTNSVELIGTGYQLDLNGNKYKVILSGDANGDGKIGYIDYVLVYNHIYKTKNPDSTKQLLGPDFGKAADLSGDGNISYLDYVKIYNKIKQIKEGINK